MLRGTDIIGQALFNLLNNFGAKVGQGYEQQTEQNMQRGILSQLMNQQTNDPYTQTGQAPQGRIIPGQAINMGIGGGPQPISAFDPRNAGLLAQLNPQHLAALQSTQPKYVFGAPGSGIVEERPGQKPTLEGMIPERTVHDAQIVTKPVLMPDGRTHNFAVGINKNTMKEIGRVDMGEAPKTGGMGGLGAAAAAAVTPEMKEFAYQQFKTDGIVPKISGMGGALATIELQKYAAQKAKQEGLPGAAFAAQRAVFATAKSGLTQVTKMSDTLTPNADAANKFIDLVKNAKYRPPTDSPVANDLIQLLHGRKITGDAEYQKYANYIYAAVREYAKVVSGASGSVQGLSDFSTRSAEEILNAMQTPDAAEASLETMRNDIAAMKSSWMEQKNALRLEIQGQVGKTKDTRKAIPGF